jgi:hypothetical protein
MFQTYQVYDIRDIICYFHRYCLLGRSLNGDHLVASGRRKWLRLSPSFLPKIESKIMYSFELTHTLTTNLVKFIFRRKSKKSTKVKQVVSHETINEIKGDIMDYDGMGNYGRFPCAK